MDNSRIKELTIVAAKARKSALTGVYNAASGHPGGSLSIADVLTYLYFEQMNVDPKNPKNPDRDRFVLSKGHCAPALYGVLAERGFFSPSEIASLRKYGSFLQGHPDMKGVPGVDMSTGSLGQGVSAANGMALSAKLSGKDYRVYTATGDGELEEGQVWEAAMFAAHYKLDNLTLFVDNNGLQIDGDITKVMNPMPIKEKYDAFGWHTIEIDGHDYNQIENAVNEAKNTKGKPTAIICKTIKGKGVSFMEGEASWHGSAPNEEQYNQAIKELDDFIKGLEAQN
ncbi:MAG: transketolase [Ruminococcaceae bacterium]|nr:transketolase [Oscillospiraceae bacterium]